MSKCSEKCEVFSRVCGYFRPVANWNKGKQEEFRERRVYEVKNHTRSHEYLPERNDGERGPRKVPEAAKRTRGPWPKGGNFLGNTKIITLEYQVRCDRCGAPIHVGEKCRLVSDVYGGWVRFEHLRCPGAGAFSLRLPKFTLPPFLTNQPALT